MTEKAQTSLRTCPMINPDRPFKGCANNSSIMISQDVDIYFSVRFHMVDSATGLDLNGKI